MRSFGTVLSADLNFSHIITLLPIGFVTAVLRHCSDMTI